MNIESKRIEKFTENDIKPFAFSIFVYADTPSALSLQKHFIYDVKMIYSPPNAENLVSRVIIPSH